MIDLNNSSTRSRKNASKSTGKGQTPDRDRRAARGTTAEPRFGAQSSRGSGMAELPGAGRRARWQECR